MDSVQLGDRVLAMFDDGRSFLFKVQDGKLQTHHGIIDLASLVGKNYGSVCETHTGERFYIMKPRLVDEIYKMKRQTQIVYPKDIGFILLMLDVHEGSRVIDAGIGSGAMCAALARAVGEKGKVYAYERREEFKRLAEDNLAKWGLVDRVEIKLRDISEGFDERVDAIFLDVPDPWNYIGQCYEALNGSGNLAIVCPTTNQVQRVLKEISKFSLVGIEVWESLFRQYKPVAERLRPFDRMVAHTAYMIFARKVMNDWRD
ncbi:MAG: tRNA (Adenine-N(1)-)-methyltransferase [Thermotoga sp. 50_1627]|nr:MAG: tRNA (Adenine-N(1)-)-methyltransferase [Thermotoga sp. 50_64]KUK25555.1 MAG: tRNA (Adenine-N(1)-)-methyltransferase [Thermotoga sp. 50_1627]MDK2922591.1 tRNA (adenine57-N1/adenine58-N1)-methyltransferase catalytic subunit [Pseudothermotoga sp.]HBT40254.1 SAM-dependent methyltransferase [Pseudothermotoga sp.]HCO98613.1 SAM-dependent methyltransferase [Pseudothermotoga sp.]